MRTPKNVKPNEQQEPVPELVEGEVIERQAFARFTMRLDDGRVLSRCFLSAKISVRTRTEIAKILPKVGERYWLELSPYDTDVGRIFLTKPKSRA